MCTTSELPPSLRLGTARPRCPVRPRPIRSAIVRSVDDTAPPPAAPRQDWRAILLVFWTTSLVEGIGVSQIFALLPTYLREVGVPEADRLAFVGLYSSLLFVVGAPLVPLWGVWADKYSRKVVIVRSALVEAVVFRLYLTYLADFKTAVGSLTIVLVVTAYCYVAAVILLLAIQLDELLREDAGAAERAIHELLPKNFAKRGTSS